MKEDPLGRKADKRENVGLRNPLKDSEAVVEQSGGGSNANHKICTTALAHSPVLSFLSSAHLAFVSHSPHDALLC